MNVLSISQNHFVRGGSDVVYFQIGRLLEARGHRVLRFAAADARNVESEWAGYFPAGADLETRNWSDPLRALYSPAAKSAMERLLDDHHVDVAHCHIYYGRLTASILPVLKARHIPIVQTLHEYRSVCPVSTLFRDGGVCTECRDFRYWNAVRHRCNRGSLARSVWSAAEMYVSDMLGAKSSIDRFLTVSHYQKRLLAGMGMDAERMTTVHNAVPASEFWEGQGAQAHVVFAGRMEDYKGIWVLAEAARLLPSCKFVLCGDGSELEALRARAAAEGLANVTFAGMVDRAGLHDVMKNALCLVAPSTWPETFGLTLVEAMAKGVPVVASDIGGMTEIVRDGETGFLVEPADAAALADRIARLWDDPRRARQMGQEARREARRSYSEDRLYTCLTAVYEQAMAARGDAAWAVS